jgi:aminoglycoside 6'-N-acetyltransferase
MEFSFHLIGEEDMSLLLVWLNKPHIKKWWRYPDETIDDVKRENDPTSYYIATLNKKPIGFIQSYNVEDYPEHAEYINLDKAIGVDLFIGEENLIGKGYGPILLKQFVEKVIRKQYDGAKYVVADPEVLNKASIRAFEKAGYTKGKIVPGKYGPEQLMMLEL